MNQILHFLVLAIFMTFGQPLLAQNDNCIPVGEDNCINAPLLSPCQLDGWMSNTAPPGITYTPGNTVPQIGWCGGSWSIENNQWLAFTAQEESLVIGVNISDCGSNSGVQMATYEAGPGYLNPGMGSCIGQQFSCIGYQSGEFTYFEYNILGLTVGEIYLIMIDGFGGDACPFSFDIVEGSTSTVNVTTNATPICPGVESFAALNGFGTDFGPEVTYLWTTQDGNIVSGETTLFPVIDQPGEYTLTVIDGASCCINAATVEVPENFVYPDAVANVEGILSCNNEEVTVNATGSSGGANDNDFAYQWYGPNGNDIAQGYELEGITESGEYTLQVVDFTTGCSSFATVDIPFDTISPTVEPEIAANSEAILGCVNNQVTIDGNGSNGVSYAWEGPDDFTSSASSPTVTVGGEYLVTVTAANGCTDVSNIEIPTDTLPPSVSATGGLINCFNPMIPISASSEDDGVSFTWSGSGISGDGEELEVSAADTYTVVATGMNGCTSSTTAIVTEDVTPPTATADVAGVLTCTTTELTLDGGTNISNASFEWSGGVTSTDEDPVVSEATTYDLVVTNLDNGCTATASVAVNENITPPDISTAVDDVLDCVTPQVGLQGTTQTTNPTYQWTGPSGFSESTANPTATEVGDYTLVITAENGCTSNSTITVEEDVTLPTADAGDSGIITCQDTETTIDASNSSTGANFAYEWLNSGGSPISSSINTSVASPGDYTLIVTNTTNGCTSTDVVNIAADENLPTADAGSPQTITCTQSTVDLGGSGSSTGATITYEWLDESGGTVSTDANTQTPVAGTFTLVVSDSSNGCETQDQVTISENTLDPTAEAGAPQTITCTTPDVMIDGAASIGTGTLQYQWTDGDGNPVSSAASFSSNNAGTYTLLITDTDNGCTATDAVTIGEDTTLPIADAGETSTITCIQAQVPLNGSASSGDNLVFEWTDADNNIVSTDASTITGDEGVYNLLVTNNVNGCTDTDQVNIDIDADFPTIDPGSPTTLTCDVTEAILDGSNSSGGTNLTYVWQDPDGVEIATDAMTSISAPGTYTLFVTNEDNDCTDSEILEIPQDIVNPESDAGSDQIITCDITDVSLSGLASSSGSEFIYEWTNETGVPLGDTNELTVSTPGTYNLIVTNTTNGCTAISSAIVEPDENIPAVAAAPEGILTCDITAININNLGSSTGATISYQWSDETNAPIGTSDNVEVSAPGLYTLLVTDSTNGCTNETTLEVQQDIVAPLAEAGEADILTCVVNSVQLDGSASTADGTLAYEWTSPNEVNIGTTPTVDVGEAGVYTLQVTNTENGCVATDQVEVEPDENLPTPNAGQAQTLTCATTTVDLDATASSGVGTLSYEWQDSNGQIVSTDAVSPVTTPDTYTIIITDASNGCTAVSNVEISQDIVNPNPMIVSPDQLTCTVETVLLDGSNSMGVDLEYEWQNSNGVVVGTTSTTSVSESGEYMLLVTDESNGCTATALTEVIPDENLPTAMSQVDDILTCIINEVTLSNTGSSVGNNFSYQWENPSGTPIGTDATTDVNVAGVYTLFVTDNNNGCVSESTIEVELDNADPQAIIEDNSPLMTCDIDAVLLNGTASMPNGQLTYEWYNSGGVLVSTIPDPEVGEVGMYNLIVTNTVNGCTNASSIEVMQDTNLPVVNLPAPNTLTCYEPMVNVLSTGSSTGDFTYEWTDENGQLISNDSSIEVDQAGVYQLNIIDNENGCDNANSVQVNVDQDAPDVVTSVDDILDCITPTVALSSAGSSVGNMFAYNWTGAGLVSSATNASPEVNASGVYSLEITNMDNGCVNTNEVIVEENTAEPNAGIIEAIDPACQGDNNGIIAVDQIIGGTAPYMYSFNGGGLNMTENFANLTAGSYTLEVEDAIGCTWDTLLNLIDPTPIDVELGPDMLIELGDQVDISAQINMDADTIHWVGADSLSCDNCLTQSLMPLTSGMYEITVLDENGCMDSDQIFIQVEINRPVFIPNAFSPADANFVNDGFTVFTKPGIVKEVRSLAVFDRWGEQVFENYNFQPNDPTLGWDGTFNGKEMDSAVFVYYTEIEFIDGVVELFKGDVTLMK